jgi:hypothetical protein
MMYMPYTISIELINYANYMKIISYFPTNLLAVFVVERWMEGEYCHVLLLSHIEQGAVSPFPFPAKKL